MQEVQFLNLISGREHGWWASTARATLRVAASPYQLATSLRNLAYDNGWLPTTRAACPVISLGNLTTGGTGKTPLVADFVERLVRQGKTPAILSRGYRALDDRGNDEKRILDRLCPGVAHYQQPDRVASAKIAVAAGANVLVLDDGFQHRRLMRDLDLVVIDATQPWGYGHLLPRGLLRESRAGLRRAQLVILSRVDLADRDTLRDIHHVVGRYGSADRIAEVAFTPRRWLEQGGSIRSLEELQNVPSVAFCGIGNPVAFERTVRPLVDVRATRVFPDHYHYTAEDGSALARLARDNGAQALVTTLKDLVKIPADFCPAELPLVALDIAAEYRSGEEAVDRAIAGVFTKSPTQTQQNQPSHTR